MSSLVSATNYRPRIRTTGMLDDVPAVPHAFDDEFTSAVIDPKWLRTGGGWAFNDANAIDPYASFTTEHRSSHNNYRPSWWMAQPANSGYWLLSQQQVIPAECFIWARCSFNHRTTDPVANDSEIGIAFYADLAGGPDINNRVNVYLNEQEAGTAKPHAFKITGGVGVTAGSGRDMYPSSLQLGALGAWVQPFCYIGIQKLSTVYHCCVGTASGQWLWFSSMTFAPAVSWMGLVGGNGSTATPGNMISGVDFFRYKAGRWLP